jgi:hypothetical protein
MSLRRVLPALVLLAVVLTGCLKMDMDIEVTSDDTVSGTLILAFPKALFGAAGQDPDDLLQGGFGDAEGVTTEPYDDGEWVGQEYRFDGMPLSAFNESQDENALTITRKGDRFVVDGVLDFTADAGTGGRDDPFGDAAGAAFANAQIRIAIGFPGEVIETNGEVEGTTVVWTPTFGERTELTAVASAGGSAIPPWVWIALGLAVVAVIAVVGIRAARRPDTVGAEELPESDGTHGPPAIPPPPV